MIHQSAQLGQAAMPLHQNFDVSGSPTLSPTYRSLPHPRQLVLQQFNFSKTSTMIDSYSILPTPPLAKGFPNSFVAPSHSLFAHKKVE